MSLTLQSPPSEVARVVVEECIRRGYSRELTIAVVSTLRQESGLRMVWSKNKKWYGYAQQDGSYPDRMDPMGNLRGFLNRLDFQLTKPGVSPDPFENIFWLQQGPNWPSAAHGLKVGRYEYLNEIKSEIAQATEDWELYGNGTAEPAPRVGFRGDPVWLPDVLRDAGLPVQVAEGAFNRGHGDMGDIWGVMAHHTGSNNASWQSIAFHPSLGLASQLHLSTNGLYTVCGVGIAWHGGVGSGYGIRDVNGTLIGIEAANDGGGKPGMPHRFSWSVVQYEHYVRGVAAILQFMNYGSDRVIAHKEWAGRSQGKWDPGAMDMDIFRVDVQQRIIPPSPGNGARKQLIPGVQGIYLP